MKHTTLESMAPAQIINEIEDIQRDVQGKLGRIQALSKALYSQVRRATPDDNTSVYIAYANAWIRFSGMANQGATRTVRASKVLKLLKQPEPDKPKVRPKPIDKKASTEEVNPVDSLLSMYAEDSDLTPVLPIIPTQEIDPEPTDEDEAE
jgi:hypothetical protein